MTGLRRLGYGRLCRMAKRRLSALTTLGLGVAMIVTTENPALGASGSASSEDSEVVSPGLLGPLSRAEIEVERPDWIEQEMSSTPDLEAALMLIELLRDAEIEIYLGTWCSDSKRELSRLWRALDELGVTWTPEITYIGVDRDKKAPQEYLRGVGVEYLPTFVVSRNGKELGRVVEESPAGIENDLLGLLRGSQSGLISARTDLLEPSSDE